MSEADFELADMVCQMGLPPNRIDISMGIDGISFAEAWPNRVSSTYDGEPFVLMSREDLITNKRASGRPQDLLDVRRLLERG